MCARISAFIRHFGKKGCGHWFQMEKQELLLYQFIQMHKTGPSNNHIPISSAYAEP